MVQGKRRLERTCAGVDSASGSSTMRNTDHSVGNGIRKPPGAGAVTEEIHAQYK